MNLRKKVLAPDNPGADMSSAESAAPKRTRPLKEGLQTYDFDIRFVIAILITILYK